MQVHPRERSARRLRWAQRRKGSKVPIAVDTLGHLLALKVTAANEQERAQVGELAQQVQAVTERQVKWDTWINVTRARNPAARPHEKASS